MSRRAKRRTKNFRAIITEEFKKAAITKHARERYVEDAGPNGRAIEDVLLDAEYVKPSGDGYSFRTSVWHFLYRGGVIVTCMHKNAARRKDINKAF